MPEIKGGFDASVTLLAHGWLDSPINEGGLFRHAVWAEGFRAAPAADAVVYIDWLANHARDPALVRRLHDPRDLAMMRLPPENPLIGGVSHVQQPIAGLILGGLVPYVEQRRADAGRLLARFDEKGIKPYQPGTIDYAKTHLANHANGHSAADVARILQAATLSADPDLIDQGLRLLDKQTALYANTVPRGVQVCQIRLHTPNILASAHMVKAYTSRYMISGNPEHPEQARYWAWTGVPFVYLVNPTEGRVGYFATIAVLGAKNWHAPVWVGLPVQWCGLVYASALHLLSTYDQDGPWQTIARGITAAGLQMTWPINDRQRQGLLPDCFHPRAQMGDGPAINPGTIQWHLAELFERGTLYSVRRLRREGWFLHAPCAIRDLQEAQDSVLFVVDGWGSRGFQILISGVMRELTVTVYQLEPDALATGGTAVGHVQFYARQGLLLIPLKDRTQVRPQF